MLVSRLALTTLVLVPVAAIAQTPTASDGGMKVPTISGFVDTTYNYNLNMPMDGLNGAFSYNSQHNNLALNSAHVAIGGEVATGLRYVVEVDMGLDAQVNTPNFGAMNPDVDLFDVQEAYGVYESGRFGFKFGRFVTYNGIEVIESPANPTVSRGYLFGLAEPFTHVGAVIYFKLTDTVDLHLGLVNGWDVVSDPNRGKTIVGKIGITPNEHVAVTLSAYAGPEQAGNNDNLRTTGDLTALVKVGSVDLWLQGNYGQEAGVLMGGGDATWFGAGVQPLIHISEAFHLGLRAELFKDSDGARTGTAQQLINLSLAPALLLSNHLTLRGEARVDLSDQPFFKDHTGATKKNQIVLLAEAIVSF
jgi:hypothetical protein